MLVIMAPRFHSLHQENGGKLDDIKVALITKGMAKVQVSSLNDSMASSSSSESASATEQLGRKAKKKAERAGTYSNPETKG